MSSPGPPGSRPPVPKGAVQLQKYSGRRVCWVAMTTSALAVLLDVITSVACGGHSTDIIFSAGPSCFSILMMMMYTAVTNDALLETMCPWNKRSRS